MDLQREKTAGFIIIITEEVYCLQICVSTSIWQRAWCQWSCFHCPCPPPGMVQQKLCCPRRQQSQNPQQWSATEKCSRRSPEGYTHLHPSCQLHIKHTHKLAATGLPAARVQQISSRKEIAKFTEQESSQTCLEVCAILWLYWHLKVTKLTVSNFLAHSFCFSFPYLMSSLKINEHLLHW